MNRRPNLPVDRTSECRSLGSNYQPYSQSRKMSIGITVESSSKCRPENSKQNEAPEPVLENTKQNPMVDRDDRATTITPGKQVEHSGKENSPWVSTRSVAQNVPTSEAHRNAGRVARSANLSHTSEKRPRATGEKETSAIHSVQFFAEQILDSKSRERKERRENKVISGRKEKDIATEGVKNFSLAKTLEETPEKVENNEPHKDSRGCETLKLKLWEILETVSSPNKHCVGSQDLNKASKCAHEELKGDMRGTVEPHSKQNSDTIESDSERPNQTVNRPVTRFYARKKPPAKQRPNQKRKSPTTSHKDHLDKDIFSFKDRWSGRFSDAENDGLFTLRGKKSTRQGYVDEEPDFLFPEMKNVEQNKQEQDKGNTLSSTEKSSSRGNEVQECKKDSVHDEPKNQEKDIHKNAPTKMMEVPKGIDSPKLQESADPPGFFCRSPSRDILQTEFGTRSPIIEMNTLVRSPSASPPVSKVHDLHEHSSGEKKFSSRGIQGFEEFLGRKSEVPRSIAQKDSSHDAGNLNDYNVDSRNVAVEDSEYIPSEPSLEDTDSDNSEDSLRTEGYQHTRTNSPDIGTADKPDSISPPYKMSKIQKNIRAEFNAASASPKGVQTSSKLMRHLEKNQDDGISRAVALFALALERLKGKVKSITQKRSAEILKQVAEEVHLQLQNAEFQIQADMGKVSELGRSKRKRLETRFQDLQGQLNGIYERFKEEVKQHLEDCRDTLEGLEAYKMELKGSMDKQRALHRKLLLQAEEAIENQLSDGQRRIETVHNLGRGKMVQLKNILAEILKEGILS